MYRRIGRQTTTIMASLALLNAPGWVVCQGYPAAEAARKMTLPKGFRAELAAAEPQIRQPVAIDFDNRGRLWVMQYLQYPNPAGLKRVKVDRFSRTAYDRFPDPPPKGPRGADRLSILDPDPNQPGKFQVKDFVAGLNLASGFAFGHGGVFVLQTPYLLFYPDRNRDDVPDSDPDVLLAGFGMEDAHSVANSLIFGPDGWLYGCQGSTVTANIRGIEFQQGVWRYHPLTRRFELFCEGGGNSWGLDFDRHGNLLYSTNAGPNVLLHGVQGGNYWKSFGKHGALHHPHAYGYFEHVQHTNFRGGHVTVGGIVYRGDNFPVSFRNKYIAADLLGHAVYWHELLPVGSTFQSNHGGELLVANDAWFAPSDVCLGPDGCVYVADWHDQRTAHPDPDADWDRSNGRVYRIVHGVVKPPATFDLGGASTTALLRFLAHPNVWYARRARQVLADRRDPEAILPLRRRVQECTDPDETLESLWTLHAVGGLSDAFGLQLLGHANPDVRRWVIRLFGDDNRVQAAFAVKLLEIAESEESPVVRSQLACTARRLPACDALPIVERMCKSRSDANDPHLPLLLWWAVERHSISSLAETTAIFGRRETADLPLVRSAMLPRLLRRYAAENLAASNDAIGRLLAALQPNPAAESDLLSAIEAGIKERSARKPAQSALQSRGDDNAARLIELLKRRYSEARPAGLARLLARLGDHAALAGLIGECSDSRRSPTDRIAAIEAIGELAPTELAGNLIGLVTASEVVPIRLAALAAWTRMGTDAQAIMLTSRYGTLPQAVQTRLRSALLGRRSWAEIVLAAVADGRLPKVDFAAEELQLVAAHGNAALDARVRKLWGAMRGPTSEERLAEVRRLNNDVRAAPGDAVRGKALFDKHCGLCHKLFGQGGAVGPDLTHGNRSDRQFLLVSIVDPSGVIRKEYLSYTAETTDGRIIAGIMTEQTPNAVVFLNSKAEKTVVRRDEIASLKESPVSIMPENIHRQLSPEQLRDLFAYLQRQ